ncbi:unnamed protein product [Lactuca saligna]|uniref:DDE Tnp4 domain-containing protein n=1 Tax=Lactuca saligna TaxID=75948 RepID=A0AA36E1W2_LACSI|nr:unnamed protein product [Lactuca saligna]
MASDCESDNSYDNDDLCDENEENEDIQTLLLCGLAVKGLLMTHKLKYVCRRRRSSSRTGSMLINEILNDHEARCYQLFILEVPVFNMLCRDLVAHYGLKKSRRVSTEESFGIFLLYLAHRCGNRLVQEFFNHYGETIHRHFHKVLDVVDCIGAIDRTHVKASVPQRDQIKYIGRKNCVTQNIMAACDFNMCFTFAWARWEGIAHDTRIFNEARRRCEVKFPLPADGKYYLVDVGYPNTKGYLAPYKGPDDGVEPHDEVSSIQRRSDDMYMSAVRDMIAGQILSRSNTRARNGTRKIMKTVDASLLLVVSDGVTGVQEYHQSFTRLPVLYNRLSNVQNFDGFGGARGFARGMGGRGLASLFS